MILFSQEIYKLLNSALTELDDSISRGKTPSNALSEAHYLGAWVTTAMKKKRFASILLATLKDWQRQARSLGRNAKLKEQFTYLIKCYNQVLDDNKEVQTVKINQLNTLYEKLSENKWMVTTDLSVGKKLNRFSGGQASLIICAEQINNCFDEQGKLIKPLSLYIRGDQQKIVNDAFTLNLLLYKKTDYKSKVKYHGEFIIYPDNDGFSLPEFPVEQTS